jgi:hypothetical protein
MPECRCRIEVADYRKKCRCRTNFFPAFRHLHMGFQRPLARITPSATVYERAELFFSTTCSLDVYVSHFKMPECRTVGHPVSPVPEWTKMPTPDPSGTGISKPVRYRTPIAPASGLREWMPECRCRRHRPRCRCPAIVITYQQQHIANIKYQLHSMVNGQLGHGLTWPNPDL